MKFVESIMQYFFLSQGHRSKYHDYKKLLSNSISSKNCFTNIKSTHFLTQEKYVIVRTSCTMKISSFISFFIRKTLPCIKKGLGFYCTNIFLSLTISSHFVRLRIWRYSQRFAKNCYGTKYSDITKAFKCLEMFYFLLHQSILTLSI